MQWNTIGRLAILPVVIFYFYLIADAVPVISMFDRTVAFLLLVVVVVMLIGAAAVRFRPGGMFYVFLLAAVLQAFLLVAMIVMEWKSARTTVFVNAVLIISLLFVAWAFRRAAEG